MVTPLPQGRPGVDLGADPLETGDPASVGGHRLLGRLGEGGMGVVYLGLDSIGRKVAVKVIRPDRSGSEEFRARFHSEVTHARRVAPFCTAQVVDHGEDGGLSYLVTEYIGGPSLGAYVTAHGGLPLGPLRSLATGVAAALTAIHAVRLVRAALDPEPSRRPTAEALLARFVGDHAQRETITDIVHDGWSLRSIVRDAVPAAASGGPGEGSRTPRWRWGVVGAAMLAVLVATNTIAYALGHGDEPETGTGRPSGNTPGDNGESRLPQNAKFSSVTGVMLKSLRAGRCVDIPGLDHRSLGTVIQVWDCNTSSPDNQRWNLMVRPGREPNGAFLFTIRNSKSGQCFDVPGHKSSVPGAVLAQEPCRPGADDNQMWYLEKKGDGRFLIRHAAGDRLCLGVAGKGRHRNEDPLALYQCGPRSDHLWSFGWS
ncbi:ricin-type beta-trefoil lectin domain protein [Actinomadura algeriensis]|uniref:Protein kinase domain-containing protein n=1 Tax=Actinomadura algeriensis TaxID=1679523 RepID=A0ABR9JPK6_9ACTN|nr:ricin-type beta-trefoil lectin domain protein [Actinomadura algeriensis]MBE1532491.1 hypothetical protein [Actinomadura algeriensis]